MFQKHHKHSIIQTSLAVTMLIIVGTGLFFVARPNLRANAIAKVENIFGETYRFPDVEKKEAPVNQEQNYKSAPIANKYLAQPQGLAVYRVKSVVDGNTIIAGEQSWRIRLIGIKAPDKDEEFGIEATDFLKKLIDGKDVFFQIDEKNPKDAFGRMRGIVYTDRKNVNIELLRNGYAHIYPTTPSIVGDTDWKQFEDEAKELKRGLWSGEKSTDKIDETKKASN